MKTNLLQFLAVCVIASLVAVPAGYAQRSLGKKKGPTSKLYMAEAVGESSVQTNDKIYTARQATAFDAPGTVIETKAGAHNALVYSNGTGMYVDQNTRVEIDRFVQEPFQPDRRERLDTPIEPSISQSNVHVVQGAVGICTSQLVSGSSMNYSTPHGNVNIRGGKISIETTPEATYIDLLDGDVTVRGKGGRDVGGQILRPGERATITPSRTGGQPTISVGPIPSEAMSIADDRTQTACAAKKTVTFDVIEKRASEGLDDPAGNSPGNGNTPSTPGNGNEEAGSGDDGSPQEIVVRPIVPETPPTNAVVSASALPGTTQ